MVLLVPVNHELRDPNVYKFLVVYVFLKLPSFIPVWPYKLSEEHDFNVSFSIPSVKCAC
jgi:hypothetical protein